MATIKKESLVIRVNPRFKQRLERLAKDKNINVSELARDLLEAGLKVEEERNSKEKELIKLEIDRIDKEIKEKEKTLYEIKSNVKMSIYGKFLISETIDNIQISQEEEKEFSDLRSDVHKLESDIKQLELTKNILMQKL